MLIGHGGTALFGGGGAGEVFRGVGKGKRRHQVEGRSVDFPHKDTYACALPIEASAGSKEQRKSKLAPRQDREVSLSANRSQAQVKLNQRRRPTCAN